MKKKLDVLIAIDSFKGSLSSLEAGNAVREAIVEVCPQASVEVVPLADGGEGTVDALVAGCSGVYESLEVTGPLGAPVQARYGILPNRTAVIEAAAAMGLPLVPEKLRDPLNTTSFGLGELIRDALDKGCRQFLIGIGGSATNDGGLGMMQALGVRFFAENGALAGIFGRDLAKLARVEVDGLDPRLEECEFKIACDVDNPLCGPQGCSRIYGPQKGATDEVIKQMDRDLERFSALMEDCCKRRCAQLPGCGAAGGLGFAFKVLTNARLQPGISLVIELLGLEERMKGKNVVVTGEGRLDNQTSMGKGPFGICALAKKYDALTVALAGSVQNAQACNESIDAFFSIQQGPISLEKALERETAVHNLRMTAEQIFRLLLAARPDLTLQSKKSCYFTEFVL